MSRLAFSLLFILISAVQMSAYKRESIDINVNGKQRNMITFVPNSLPAKSPLFIVTHGMNCTPEQQIDADRLYEMIDTAKFVVTYLRSDGNTWDIGGTVDQNFVIKTIDEMASRYDIDRDRVYWSGFSMGSMLIHHCIGAMQSRIAAFAPTSGIQFSEQPWYNCQKPVNMLEVIAYDDDVFGYEQYGIHAYMENYAKHDNHPNYSKTVGYKPMGSSNFDGDLEKWTGGPNGGEIWLYSYHKGSHWPNGDNRQLIWNFVKRFSLNQPTVKFVNPSGPTIHLYMAPAEEIIFPDLEISVTPKSPNGKVVKLDVYDGNTLIGSRDVLPWKTTISAPARGKHNIRAEITDNVGKTATAWCLVNNVTSQGTYIFSNLNNENGVPVGWYVSDGSKKRIGSDNTYSDGCRILHFTNSSKAFEYGLLVQNATGKERGSWARFGTSTGRSTLTLFPGHYALKYKICNWNQPDFSPVTVSIYNSSNQEVASEVFTPLVNIGGDVANKFARLNNQVFEFDITEADNYSIVFYPDAKRNADFVLGSLILQAVEFTATDIHDVMASQSDSSTIYDLSGRLISKGNLKPGIYIIDGRKILIR